MWSICRGLPQVIRPRQTGTAAALQDPVYRRHTHGAEGGSVKTRGELVVWLVCGNLFLLAWQEFAQSMEPENIKSDLMQLFHNLANDEQVLPVRPFIIQELLLVDRQGAPPFLSSKAGQNLY